MLFTSRLDFLLHFCQRQKGRLHLLFRATCECRYECAGNFERGCKQRTQTNQFRQISNSI